MILGSHSGKLLENPRLVEREALIHSREGETIPVRFSGVILFDLGKPVGSVGFLEDFKP